MPAKELILVGGPNGAGKTTFIRSFLRSHSYPYLGADEIAARLRPHDVASAQIEAGREFLLQFDERLQRDESFIVESTLSGRTLARWIERAKKCGFAVLMFFVYVDDADASLKRVAERVRKGRHDVPESDIRRRFLRAFHNFWHLYRPLADLWILEYNGGSEPYEVAIGRGDDVTVYNQNRFDRFTGDLQLPFP